MTHPLPVHEAAHRDFLRHGWPDAAPEPRAARTTTPPWGFRAFPTREHDGDSFWVLLDLGFSCRAEVELRLADVRAPEVRGLAIPRMMQPGGRETTEFVSGWLRSVQARSRRRWWLWVDTVMETTFEPDQRQSFTRYVATVYDHDRRDPAESLNAAVGTFLSGHPEWPTGE